MENLDKLVNELRKLPTETQWLEFKHNNYTPDMIGKDMLKVDTFVSIGQKHGSSDRIIVNDTENQGFNSIIIPYPATLKIW